MTIHLIPDCGLCDIPHRCHCSRLMAFCRVCLPAAFDLLPASDPQPAEVEAGRLTGRLETSRPRICGACGQIHQSDYARREIHAAVQREQLEREWAP